MCSATPITLKAVPDGRTVNVTQVDRRFGKAFLDGVEKRGAV
jgi:hypothetical protein